MRVKIIAFFKIIIVIFIHHHPLENSHVGKDCSLVLQVV